VRRIVPLSGVVFVVLVIISVLLGGSTPGSDASGEKIASYYDSHDVRLFIESFLLAASGLFAVVFGATLARHLRPADDGARSIWERVALAGATLIAGALAVIATINFALADQPTEVSATALQALNLLENATWVLFNTALGIFMLPIGILWLATRRRLRWLGWIALVLGIALFIPYADFVALLASGLWIIGTSILLFWQRDAVRVTRSA
jgi:hypothetical protein